VRFSRPLPYLRYDRRVPLRLIDHPLVHHALLELRDTRTMPGAFRMAGRRISVLLAVEALRDLPTEAATVTTPLGAAEGRLVGADVVLVPVLRAGLGMLDAVLSLVPDARVGHIGLQRDERTAAASNYYAKLPPDLAGSFVLLLDPMLATGGSASAALDHIKTAGATRVSMICIVAAPEGLALLEERHPDVAVFTPVVDRELDARKFIVPGLGDFGDRLYGTK
jgi:uracil phosphoribosyltransferase